MGDSIRGENTQGALRRPECEAAVGWAFVRAPSHVRVWRCSVIAGWHPLVPTGLFLYVCLRLAVCFSQWHADAYWYLLDNFDNFIVVINDMKKFKIFEHNSATTKLFSFHKLFEVVPEFRADTNERYVGYLFCLDESQNFEKFVKGAKPAGVKDERLGREGKADLAHEEIIRSE